MTDAPIELDEAQLKELGLQVLVEPDVQ
jgi:hypothetical protein